MNGRRGPCVVCWLLPIVAIVLIVTLGFGLRLVLGTTPRLPDLSQVTVTTPTEACCAAVGCCAGGAAASMPPLSVNGPMWFLIIPVLLLAGLLAIVLFAGVIIVLMLLGGGSLTALGNLAQVAAQFLQMLPGFKQFIQAMRDAADGLDAGKTATDLIGTALRTAAAQVGYASDAVNSADLPGLDWRLRRVGTSPLYYVRFRHDDEQRATPFSTARSYLAETNTQLTAAGNQTDELGKGLTEAAKQLREAAHQLETLLP